MLVFFWNDNKEIDNKCHQLMRFCCYLEPIETCTKKQNQGKVYYFIIKKT